MIGLLVDWSAVLLRQWRLRRTAASSAQVRRCWRLASTQGGIRAHQTHPRQQCLPSTCAPKLLPPRPCSLSYGKSESRVRLNHPRSAYEGGPGGRLLDSVRAQVDWQVGCLSLPVAAGCIRTLMLDSVRAQIDWKARAAASPLAEVRCKCVEVVPLAVCARLLGRAKAQTSGAGAGRIPSRLLLVAWHAHPDAGQR